MRRTPRQAVPTTGIMPRLKFVTISPKSEAASELILEVSRVVVLCSVGARRKSVPPFVLAGGKGRASFRVRLR